MSSSSLSSSLLSSSVAEVEKGPAKSGVPNVAYSNPRRWMVVYPRYLDLDATVAEGRRIARNFCVSQPTVPDLLEAAQMLQLNVVFEDKMYSRDFWQRGRLRIQLRKDDGSWIHTNIRSKKALLQQIGAIIPKLPNRTARTQQLEGMKKQAQQANMPFIMPQFVPINPHAQRAPQAQMGMGMGVAQAMNSKSPLGSPSAAASASASANASAPSPSTATASSSSSSSSSAADGDESASGGGGGGEKKKKKKKGKK